MKQLLYCKMTIICGKYQSKFTGTITISPNQKYMLCNQKSQSHKENSEVFREYL